MSTFIPPDPQPRPQPGAAMAVSGAQSSAAKPVPLLVTISHEPFLPWFTLEYGGQTEELDHEQALEWFRNRGAKDMEKVNEAINQAFNFHSATYAISSPKAAPHRPEDVVGYEPNI